MPISLLIGETAMDFPTYANDGSVWDGYFGVYHLEGGSGNAIDSSPIKNDLPGINTPTLVQSGIAGVAYKTNDTDFDGFLIRISQWFDPIQGRNLLARYSLPMMIELGMITGLKIQLRNQYFSYVQSSNNDYPFLPFKRLELRQVRTPFGDPKTDIADGVWKFVTFTISNGQIKCYVNGTEESSSQNGWVLPWQGHHISNCLGRGFSSRIPTNHL